MSGYTNVLAAIDLSAAAEEVCRRAAELADRYRASLTILHVAEYVPPLDIAYEPITPSDWMIDENLLAERAGEALEKLAERLGIAAAKRLVRLGIPKHTIIETAAAEHADLLVLGSHGRHGISRLLGSTADSVLHSAECDVLAVRTK